MKHFLYQQLRLAPGECGFSYYKSVGNQQIKHKPQII